MRQVRCNYKTRTEYESGPSKLKGHCGKYYVSAESTLKESLRSPPTLILVTESHGYILTVQVYKLNQKTTKTNKQTKKLYCSEIGMSD